MPAPELEAFQRSLRSINATRGRMEQLFQQNRIKKTDIETLYEALFLRSVTSFESFLENLFISIMLGKEPTAKGVSLMKARSKPALHGILLQGDRYLDWLPYGKTEGRAQLYLKNGRPFTSVTDGDKSQIKTVTLIRNAIAHKSEYAMKEFKHKVIGGRLLLSGETRPAGFLRSQIRASPRQLRFEVYVSELARIAASLC